MSKTTKVVLIIAGAAVAMLVLLIAGGVWWFQRNVGEWKEITRVAVAEGRSYGQGRPSGECIEESLRRLERQPGFNQELGHGFFLRACLATAQQPPGFCDGVPPTSEIMASVQFRLARCTAHHVADQQACGRIVQGIQEHCHKGPLKELPMESQAR